MADHMEGKHITLDRARIGVRQVAKVQVTLAQGARLLVSTDRSEYLLMEAVPTPAIPPKPSRGSSSRRAHAQAKTAAGNCCG